MYDHLLSTPYLCVANIWRPSHDRLETVWKRPMAVPRPSCNRLNTVSQPSGDHLGTGMRVVCREVPCDASCILRH